MKFRRGLVLIKTGGMMGRGSDTRMYVPRSESSTLFRNNDGEDRYESETPFSGRSPSDPRYADAVKEKRQKEQDRQDNIVSGSDGSVVDEATVRTFGWFYPDIGTMVFSGA